VGSYLHHFTFASAEGAAAVYFLWHFPWARARRGLPGTLLYGARTFLAGISPAAVTSPTRHAVGILPPAPLFEKRLSGIDAKTRTGLAVEGLVDEAVGLLVLLSTDVLEGDQREALS
jgi:hypothetical protein